MLLDQLNILVSIIVDLFIDCNLREFFLTSYLCDCRLATELVPVAPGPGSVCCYLVPARLVMECGVFDDQLIAGVFLVNLITI